MLPFLLSGCNFTNCTIAFAGNVTSRNEDVDDLLEGISVNELFDDSV